MTPLRAVRAALFCLAALVQLAAVAHAGDGDEPVATAAPRVEARSPELLAVGIVHGDRMSIHLSRLIDNSPVRDATLNVVLRGVVHPTLAEADGSYTLQTKDLDLPGTAAVVFKVAGDGGRGELTGTLEIAQATAKPADANSARQLWWWVLNFAVCIGFLMLLSRRRRAAAARETDQ